MSAKTGTSVCKTRAINGETIVKYKYIRILPLVAGLMLGAGNLAIADEVTFRVTDTPGHWFDTGVDIAGTRSLAIIKPGDTVHFIQKDGNLRDVESKHTVTSLIWPSNAIQTGPNKELIDQEKANKDDHHLTLTTPGLYVFVCKLHPYMLGAVIVDSDSTKPFDLAAQPFDLGANLTLLGPTVDGKVSFPTASDLGYRLLRAFFVVTNPGNWKDYAKVNSIYQPTYPDVMVNAGPGIDVNLKSHLEGQGYDGQLITKQYKPGTKGIGEVWIDTAFELTKGKPEWNPGTMTVVSATAWDVKRKIALPEQKMNNGHNMWASHDQKQIYQTEWHGTSLFVLNRANGKLLQEINLSNQGQGDVGNDPAHVMTRVDTEQVHVTLNGEDTVAELDREPSGFLKFNRYIKISKDAKGKQTQPHAHWMGFDGKSMATPNSNTNDSSLFDFSENLVVSQEPTGALPIAAGMMPDSSKYYVSNYLGHTISVMCGPVNIITGCIPGKKLYDIPLLLNGNYDTDDGEIRGPVGALPIQTPVSPDGKFVITGNTLTGTITIIRTLDDVLVAMIPCDPGCHGVNFGAKKGGGYYAYVTSKFANRLIVLDYDPDNNGNVDDAVIAGAVVLAKDNVPKDDTIIGNRGQGGQGVLAVPNVYNGWVQGLPIGYKAQLTRAQRNPIGPLPGHNPHDK
ncbi:MAG: copper oxidase [Nitrospirota bacterium]|nr:copper oxidase [Nitrospirota bacterium]